MDRRKFIQLSAMTATLAGISPSLLANNGDIKGKKTIVFVFRGVSYTDAFNAFKKFNITSDLSFFIQKTTCLNNTYTHTEGFDHIINGLSGKKSIHHSELMEESSLGQVIETAMKNAQHNTQVYWMHHTEIGHSSEKLYKQQLDDFFTELSKYYNPAMHKIVVTADIGRNEKLNSCGGRDHSNATCLETFTLYLGGKASKLAQKNMSLDQGNILKQKF